MTVLFTDTGSATHGAANSPFVASATRGTPRFMMKCVAWLIVPVVAMSGCSNQASDNSSTSTTSSGSSSAQKLTTQLNTADGRHAADATILRLSRRWPWTDLITNGDHHLAALT
jgi:hypothetical protein